MPPEDLITDAAPPASATPVVAPPPAPAPLPVTSPPPPAPGLNPDTHCAEDGKAWREKFFGAQGRLTQVEADLQKKIGRLEAQVAALQGGVNERDATIAALSQTADEMTSLREQLTTTQAEAAMARRLQALIRFPDLLTLTVTEEVTVGQGDDAATEMQTRNPVMAFLNSTTLEGDDLIAALQDLASAMGVRAAPQAPVTPATTVAGAVPTPAAPAAPANELDAARQEAMKWHQLGIEGKQGPNGENPAEEERKAWTKFRDLESAQADAA